MWKFWFNRKDSSTKLIKEDKIKYYRATWIQITYGIDIILVFLMCILGFPLFLKLIFCLFSEWTWIDSEIAKDVSIFNLLPDFLGGLVGILVGFIIGEVFIDKIKYLSKYKALRALLIKEFQDILNGPKDYISSEINVKRDIDTFDANFAKFKQAIVKTYLNIEYPSAQVDAIKPDEFFDDKLKSVMLDLEFQLFVLDDVVNSAENDVLFYYLPTLFIPWGFKRRTAEYLHRISAAIDRFNSEVETDYDKKLGYLMDAYVYIFKVLKFLDKDFEKSINLK